MNWIKQTALAGFVLWLAIFTAAAQTNLSSTAQPTREGVVVSPDKLTVTDNTASANVRPDRPEREELPPEVQERLQKFRQLAKDYLNNQEELKKQLVGANEKDRAAVREQIDQAREAWLERAREFRKEFRERQQELVDKLPDYGEVINAAREAALQSARQTAGDTRPHRGED